MNGVRRDQNRAAIAYGCVRAARDDLKDAWKDYKIAVDRLGPTVLQNGLVAAFAFLERDKSKGPVQQLFKDLAKAGIPGLGTSGDDLPERVRNLDTDEYMLATRETLHVVHWFKRACQALDED